EVERLWLQYLQVDPQACRGDLEAAYFRAFRMTGFDVLVEEDPDAGGRPQGTLPGRCRKAGLPMPPDEWPGRTRPYSLPTPDGRCAGVLLALDGDWCKMLAQSWPPLRIEPVPL